MNKGPELPQVRLIGFCGPQDPAHPAAMAGALREQLKLQQSGCARLLALATLAGSGDFIFAREALSLGLPLRIVLPLPSEEWKKNLPEAQQTELDQILARAVKVEALSVPPKDQAMISIGAKWVDEADILLVAWDGAEKKPAGETAEVVSLAVHRECPMVFIRMDENEIEVREINPANAQSYTETGIEQLQKMAGEPPAAAVIPEELVRFFQECDRQATNTAPRVRRYMVNIVLANAIASMAGTIQTSFPQTHQTGAVLTAIKFGCILLGLIIFVVMTYRHAQNRWLDLRLKAEICRSAMATWRLPRVIEAVSPEEVPELRGMIQTIRYLHATHHFETGISLKEFKAEYGVRRLMDQYNYFHGQADSAIRLSFKLGPLYWVFSGLALLTSGGAIIYQIVYGHRLAPGTWMNFVFAFVPAVAPALASWVLAIQAIKAIGRRRSRFREMERLMKRSLTDLVHCHTWEATQQVVEKAEKILMHEILEWYAFTKYSSR